MLDKSKDPAIVNAKNESLKEVINSVFLFLAILLLMLISGIIPKAFKVEAFWVASAFVTVLGFLTIALWRSNLRHKTGFTILLVISGFIGPAFFGSMFHAPKEIVGSGFVYLEILFIGYIYSSFSKYIRSTRKIKELITEGVSPREIENQIVPLPVADQLQRTDQNRKIIIERSYTVRRNFNATRELLFEHFEKLNYRLLADAPTSLSFINRSDDKAYSPKYWPCTVTINLAGHDLDTEVSTSYVIDTKQIAYPWNKAYWMAEIDALKNNLMGNFLHTSSHLTLINVRAIVLTLLMLVPWITLGVILILTPFFDLKAITKFINHESADYSGAALLFFNAVIAGYIFALVVTRKKRRKGLATRW